MAVAAINHAERPARASSSAAATAIVVLHSAAGDEAEARELLDGLDPEGRHLGLLPLGPLRLTPEGHNWYRIERLAAPEPDTFLPTLSALFEWLDRTLAVHGVEPARAALAGFSQGAAMAYSLGLAPGRPNPPAIAAFAGYIPRVEGFDLDLDGRDGVRVAIAHGTADESVALFCAHEARDRLIAAGLDVRYTEEPVGHEVTPAALAQARAVLTEALRPA